MHRRILLPTRVAKLANFDRETHAPDMDRYGFAQLQLIGEGIGAFYDPGIGTRKSVSKLLRAYSDAAYKVERLRLRFECEARLSSLPAKDGPLPGSFCGTNQPDPAWLEAMRKTQPKPEADRGIVEEAVRKVADQRAAKRAQIIAELAPIVNRHSLERAGGDTPDYILVEAMLDAALAFGKTTRARDRHQGRPTCAHPQVGNLDPRFAAKPNYGGVGPGRCDGRETSSFGEKVGPATGHPRTEVPLAADGSGTVVELGEAFWVAMRESGTADHEGQCLRRLRDAPAELAKVVERIGAWR